MIAIETTNLTRRFGTFTAVDHVSFRVDSGQIFGFLGPNGSGKSTCIRMLCGVLAPSDGTATVVGYDVVTHSDQVKRSIGYMNQSFSLYRDLSVRENLDFFAGIYGIKGSRLKERRDAVVDTVGLAPYVDRPAGQLSGGWKQRLGLATALIHDPPVIFLDEPTAGIDPVARRDLWDLLFSLAGQGKTLFVTTHYMDEAERCNLIGYIYLSKLMVLGTPRQLKALPEVRKPGTRRVAVMAEPPSQALMALKRAPWVLDATLMEAEIHLLLHDATSDADISLWLAQAGLSAQEVRPIDPSLEDVFVSLTRQLGGLP